MSVMSKADDGESLSASAVPVTTVSPPAPLDGRRLRSERTKQLIIEAYLALLRDNPVAPMPTAARIAERAGYSVRSIFERFPDLNKLRLAAADYGLAQAAAFAPPRNIDGDRQARIKSQVETRAGTCERGVALWRVLLFSVDQDDELKTRVRIARERTVERMEVMYRTELATLSAQERKYLLIALEAITDIESWARLRELYRLSFEDACAVWLRAVDRMLPPTPAAG
jgi:AcrR family transcriptional regulator